MGAPRERLRWERCRSARREASSKTTLDLDDDILAKAKALAAREQKSLTLLIEEGLRLRLRKRSSAIAPRQTRVPVYRGKGGVVRGVDPTSNRSMLEAVERDT